MAYTLEKPFSNGDVYTARRLGIHIPSSAIGTDPNPARAMGWGLSPEDAAFLKDGHISIELADLHRVTQIAPQDRQFFFSRWTFTSKLLHLHKLMLFHEQRYAQIGNESYVDALFGALYESSGKLPMQAQDLLEREVEAWAFSAANPYPRPVASSHFRSLLTKQMSRAIAGK